MDGISPTGSPLCSPVSTIFVACPSGQAVSYLRLDGLHNAQCTSTAPTATSQPFSDVVVSKAVGAIAGQGAKTVNCPSGRLLVGGGYEVAGPLYTADLVPAFVVYESRPIGNGWRVSIRNLSTIQSTTLRVHAVCF